MKRKLSGIFCLSIVLIALSGCSSNSELDQLKEENAKLKNQIESIEDTSANDTIKPETTETTDKLSNDSCEYAKYMIDSGMYHYAIVVLKNTSSEVIDVSIDLLLKDDNNNTIGVENDSIYDMVPGKEIALYYLQENSFSDFDVNLSVETVENPSDVINIDDIKTNISRSDNKLIISATNNTADKNILIINELVLYFKDGKLVDFDNPMFEDMSGIAPCQTSYAESHANVDFDDYKFYYNTTSIG